MLPLFSNIEQMAALKESLTRADQIEAHMRHNIRPHYCPPYAAEVQHVPQHHTNLAGSLTYGLHTDCHEHVHIVLQHAYVERAARAYRPGQPLMCRS